MGKKKRSWFSYVKRLFIPRPKPEEHSKKWAWLFEKLKLRQYAAIKPPGKVLNEATEEQRKRALAVAIATAAAAEAAIAAANAAAEVVRLTNIPYEHETKSQHRAAVKIQCAYRRHLAKKALKALKGVVKLQAVVRGELVRRRVAKSLPSSDLLLTVQSQVPKRKAPTLLEFFNHGEKVHCLRQKEGSKSQEQRPQRLNWDPSMVLKEEMEALYLQKQEAIAKRDRMKQYSFSQRERRSDQTQEPVSQKEGRKGFRIDSFGNQLLLLKLRSDCKQERLEELKSPFSLPRRSFCHAKHNSIGDDEGSATNSPILPAYMAVTESARAKCRSLSTPRQRLRLCDTYLGEHSLHKLKLMPWSSFNGEITSSARNSVSHQLFSTFGTLN